MGKRRHHSRLLVKHGERYALLPLEVAESPAWGAVPPYAGRVLIALLLEYYGSNNGCLGLTFTQARARGVPFQRELYAGLKILSMASLIICTRRGRLEKGAKLPSLYAISWRGIDEPRDGVTYDEGITVCPIPRHDWARWEKPEDWLNTCRGIMRSMRGQSRKSSITTPVRRPLTTSASRKRKTTHHTGEKETGFSAHHTGEASEISGVPPAPKPPSGSSPGSALVTIDGERIRRQLVALPECSNQQVADELKVSIEQVAQVRAQLGSRRVS
jgi:hypothetical protein